METACCKVNCIETRFLTYHDNKNSVRIRTSDSEAYINIKREVNIHVRKEFEYPIPMADALEMLGICEGNNIEKVRHLVEFGGYTWEIDEFSGLNAGLVVAEVELESEDAIFDRPDWVGDDVSDDYRYRNSSLVKVPYSQW